MPDDPAAAPIDPQEARRKLAFLAELQPDLRGAAIFGPDRELVAATGEPGEWATPAVKLLQAADYGPSGPALEAHVATQAGEVFMVKEAGAALVAVTDRFVLASLLTFDMRTVLRQAGEAAR